MLNKEAVKYLMESGIKPENRVVTVGERVFFIDDDGQAREMQPPKVHGLAHYPFGVHTLTGLVDFIKAKLDRSKEKLYLHIESNVEVYLKGLLEKDGSRETLAVAQAVTPNLHGFFDYFHDAEDFNIKLSAKFTEEYDREKVIKFVGNVKEEGVKQTSDDGFSQQATVRTGVASVEEMVIPNPVKLAPYRTFTEVAQPESLFILRGKNGPRFALFEADGGAWKNIAISNIKAFFEGELNEEIQDGRITILA